MVLLFCELLFIYTEKLYKSGACHDPHCFLPVWKTVFEGFVSECTHLSIGLICFLLRCNRAAAHVKRALHLSFDGTL